MGRDDWDDDVILEDDTPSTRPYVVTGGNTRPTADVAIETLVEAGPVSSTDLRFEKGRVMELATAPLSVAELSAHLNMPIGTTMVLVGELIGDGQLVSHQTISNSNVSDLSIMTRIINRVREL